MKRLFFFIFLHLIVFLILITSYAYAEEKVFTCKPVFVSIQLKNGEYYSETNDDEPEPDDPPRSHAPGELHHRGSRPAAPDVPERHRGVQVALYL